MIQCWGANAWRQLGRSFSLSAPRRTPVDTQVHIHGRVWSIDPACIGDRPITMEGDLHRLPPGTSTAPDGSFDLWVTFAGPTQRRFRVHADATATCDAVSSGWRTLTVRT